MIKKLLLLTGLTISTSLWANPMDNICYVWIDLDRGRMLDNDSRFINSKCERNNVLQVNNLNDFYLTGTVANWCRYDRNVVTQSRVQELGRYQGEMTIDLTCILYDRFAREPKTVKQ